MRIKKIKDLKKDAIRMKFDSSTPFFHLELDKEKLVVDIIGSSYSHNIEYTYS